MIKPAERPQLPVGADDAKFAKEQTAFERTGEKEREMRKELILENRD